jgi:molybdopterin-binding protein
VTASITGEAVDGLALRPGDEVYAVVKASDIRWLASETGLNRRVIPAVDAR